MIKINESKVDLILQCEEHTKIQNVFDMLTLDITDVLIISPETFLQRFIQANQEEFTMDMLEYIEELLQKNNSSISISLPYKKKSFYFHFILIGTAQVVINNPFKGDQIMNVGFKKIEI